MDPARRDPKTSTGLITVLAAIGGVLLGLGFLGVVFEVKDLVRGSESQELRKCVLETTGTPARRFVTLELGRGFWLGARAVSRWLEMPEEARIAVDSLRSVEVSVFRANASASSHWAEVLTRADGVMRRRGWERVVGVMQDGQGVRIYVPAGIEFDREAGICLFAAQGEELVVLRARGDLRPLLQAAREAGNGSWGAWREQTKDLDRRNWAVLPSALW